MGIIVLCLLLLSVSGFMVYAIIKSLLVDCYMEKIGYVKQCKDTDNKIYIFKKDQDIVNVSELYCMKYKKIKEKYK